MPQLEDSAFPFLQIWCDETFFAAQDLAPDLVVWQGCGFSFADGLEVAKGGWSWSFGVLMVLNASAAALNGQAKRVVRPIFAQVIQQAHDEKSSVMPTTA